MSSSYENWLPIIVPTIKATPLKSPSRLSRWTGSFFVECCRAIDFRIPPVLHASVSDEDFFSFEIYTFCSLTTYILLQKELKLHIFIFITCRFLVAVCMNIPICTRWPALNVFWCIFNWHIMSYADKGKKRNKQIDLSRILRLNKSIVTIVTELCFLFINIQRKISLCKFDQLVIIFRMHILPFLLFDLTLSFFICLQIYLCLRHVQKIYIVIVCTSI